jgi:hypothetical protein
MTEYMKHYLCFGAETEENHDMNEKISVIDRI